MEWKCHFIEERLENTKGVSSSHKSKDRHYTGQQQQTTKGQTMIYKTIKGQTLHWSTTTNKRLKDKQ